MEINEDAKVPESVTEAATCSGFQSAEFSSLPFRLIEFAAVIATLICVWLAAKENVLNWPVGILGAALYIYVFYNARLYSDVLLQVYFLATSLYGWYRWTHSGASVPELPVIMLSLPARAGWIGVMIAAWLVLGTVMKRRTRAALPYWDAGMTVTSLVAQYFLTEKVLESWVLWIIVDAVYIGIYHVRRLYLTAALYGILLVLATHGLLEWLHKL